jgi:hypothetical protein
MDSALQWAHGVFLESRGMVKVWPFLLFHSWSQNPMWVKKAPRAQYPRVHNSTCHYHRPFFKLLPLFTTPLVITTTYNKVFDKLPQTRDRTGPQFHQNWGWNDKSGQKQYARTKYVNQSSFLTQIGPHQRSPVIEKWCSYQPGSRSRYHITYLPTNSISKNTWPWTYPT